jgi:hypothetical protein
MIAVFSDWMSKKIKKAWNNNLQALEADGTSRNQRYRAVECLVGTHGETTKNAIESSVPITCVAQLLSDGSPSIKDNSWISPSREHIPYILAKRENLKDFCQGTFGLLPIASQLIICFLRRSSRV